MKRPVLHITFWLVYIVQDALLHFTWMAPYMKNVSGSSQVLMAVTTAFILLLPKLLAVYYFILFGLKRVMDDRKDLVKMIIEPVLILVVSLLLFRIIFHYVVMPQIYLLPPNVPFFDVKSTLIAVLDMGYVTGIAIAFKLLRLQTSSMGREKNLVKEKLETELKFLRNQTNPHFLFNTLNNIYALARKKSDETPEVVMKLSELLSFMLYESGKDTIAISEEVKMIEDYIDLQKIRYSNRLSIQFDRKIDNDIQPIAPLLLLPLVENAFKHGVSETRFDSFINIDMQLSDGRLIFFITNTIENGKPKPGNNNIGLPNIKRQLELMYKDHEMLIQNDGKTFNVNISINLNSYGKV
jgi:two-component system LytT family sensor kinase